MAGGKLNPDMETANGSEWRRASALWGLLTRSSPAAIEEVARDLKLSPGHGLQAVGPLSQESIPECFAAAAGRSGGWDVHAER
jgi:hypothetical protein